MNEPNKEAPVDLDRLRAEWTKAGIADAVDEIVQTFLEHTAQKLPQLEEAIRGKDLAEAARVAHNLKSGSSTVHANRLSEIFRKIESLDPETDIAEAQQLYEDAAREFRAVREALEKSGK